MYYNINKKANKCTITMSEQKGGISLSKKGKSIDSLMRHIRDNHMIEIKGYSEKRYLLNMGYYHGYKALRFIRIKKNIQPFTNFSEIQALYDFDIALKSILYPMLVKYETSVKNRLIDYLVANDSVDIETIYDTKLTDYREKEVGSKKYNEYLKLRLKLRKDIDETIAYNYGKNRSIIHFFHTNRPLPLWSYFEVTTFGHLGDFVARLNEAYRIGLSKKLNLSIAPLNENGRIIEQFISCIRELRNATMHNSIVCDCRFKNQNTSQKVIQYAERYIGINNINFESIIDYFILLIFLLRKLDHPKSELNKYITDLNRERERLYNAIPSNTYFELLGTDARTKLDGIKLFIKNN